MKFKEWFETKLVIGGYPMPIDVEESDYNYIINVSDEHHDIISDKAISKE